MEQNDFNVLVGQNLAKYRKHNGYTQLKLAEKLNYSDKAISKWESGESLPDVYILKQIADIYGVSVNDLISPSKKVKTSSAKIKKVIVPAISCCIVWLTALLTVFVLELLPINLERTWLTFITAIPITFIVLLVFASVYHFQGLQLISISGIIWTTCLTITLFIKPISSKIYNLYYMAIPVQIAFVLFYLYKIYLLKKQKNK